MKQSPYTTILYSHLMKAHQHMILALDEHKKLPILDRLQLENTCMHTRIIDMEILQLLNGKDSLEFLFDDE